MFKELIAAHEVIHFGEASAPEHVHTDEHHSPEDWKAFFNAMDHHTAFERRHVDPPKHRS